ncbi:MAG TPA: response regulator transcription factor [Mycobacterium sp.]|nr:response regulator transcription factor [Mycobacterium sp.]
MPGTEFVFETIEDNPVFAHHALEAGAIGYVRKENAGERALAIRRAVRGPRYVSPRVAAGLAAFRRAAAEDDLSEREIEVVRLIALGRTSVEIAALLHLSRRTIKTTLARHLIGGGHHMSPAEGEACGPAQRLKGAKRCRPCSELEVIGHRDSHV